MFLNKRLLLIIVLMAVLILLGATATDIRLDKKKTGNLAVDDIFFYLQSLVYNGRLVVGDSSPSYGNIPVRDSACWKFPDELIWDSDSNILRIKRDTCGIHLGSPTIYGVNLKIGNPVAPSPYTTLWVDSNLYVTNSGIFNGGVNFNKNVAILKKLQIEDTFTIRGINYFYPNIEDSGFIFRHIEDTVTLRVGHSGVINILDGDQITTHVLTFDRGILKTYATQ